MLDKLPGGTPRRRVPLARVLAVLPAVLAALPPCPARAETARPAALVAAIERASPAPDALPPGCQAGALPPGLEVRDGRVATAPLLAEMEGFAAVAGTTGGLGRPLLRVTSAADAADAPAGGVRAALARATAAGGGWVLFDAAALGPAPVVELAGDLRLPPNTTLDGGCSGVTLTGPGRGNLLVAWAENLVITRLRLRKHGPFDAADDDCVNVAHGFDRVWIVHNDFGPCADGQVDVTMPRPRDAVRRITIAYNRFADHDAAMLADAVECEPSAAACADPLAFGPGPAPEVLLTLQGNLFLRTGQRHPRAAGRVLVHAANQVVAFRNVPQSDGRLGSAYGIFAGIGARVLVEESLVFQALARTPNPPLAAWTSRTPGALRMPDPPGALRTSHLLTAGPEVVGADHGALVPSPPYRLGLLDFARLGAEAAATCVAARAGVAGAAAWPPGCGP